MSAIQARIYYAMKQEFKLLKEIIAENCPAEYPYEPEEGGRHAMQADYDTVYIIPVADPNAATMAQKVVQYQAALQLAQSAPQLYDLPILHRQMLDVLGIKNYQKLVPIADDMKPRDPVSENQYILMQKPVKAFIYQDHKAHITVHMAAVQDPHIQELIGQNPQMAQTISAAMSAHVAEHLGMEYRKQLEQTMGTTLPPFIDAEDSNEKEMTPEMEVQISQMAAQASQQLLQQHQQESQQQKNQQAQQDPLIQIQQQEVQIKAQDLQRKTQKDMSDAQLKEQQIQVERERIAAQQHTAGAQAALKMYSEEQSHNRNHELEGAKSGVDLSKHNRQLDHQQKLAEMQANLAARQPAQKPKPKSKGD